MGDVFNTILDIAQGLTAAITLLILLVKPFRLWLFSVKNRKKEEDEAFRCMLRNMITQTYYSHKATCELHQYEYENIAKIYTAYKQLQGNSFVDKIWEEIQDWVVIQ